MNKPTIDLSKATDGEINVMIARHVANLKGMVRDKETCRIYHEKPNNPMWEFYGKFVSAPDYLNGPHAVITLLESYVITICRTPSHNRWIINCGGHIGDSSTFCKAACIALLRASGVTVRE